jgi:hypothetical protein
MPSGLEAPQLVINSRMLYFGWLPADPDAVKALVPDGLTADPNGAVFMNQYVVDSEDQTSHFGEYSLTYMGPDLAGIDAPGGAFPGRWWTHYYNSNPTMIEYTRERGVPATPGSTTLEISGDTLVATTHDEGTPIIRSTVTVGEVAGVAARGMLRYITEVNGEHVSGNYPFVSEPVDPFEVTKLEFLEPGHSSYALRPSDPLEVTWGFYSPRASFCYPGGEVLVSEVVAA